MANPKRVPIASDHAGVDLKTQIKTLMPEISWDDLGPSDKSRVDYPDYAAKLARKIESGEAERGVLICGSGIGMCIAANKFPGVRAAVVENPVAARLTREHNDANVLCLGSRFIAPEYGVEIVEICLATPFSNGERHVARIE